MEMNINPGTRELPKLDVIEQRADYIKSRMEYSNGFIMINEIKGDSISLSANYHLIRELDGTVRPDFNNPNINFVDVL